MKFAKPYKIFITRTVNEAVAESEEMAEAVYKAAERFAAGDWGDLGQEDKEYNDADLANRDGHVLGKYATPQGDIYINLIFDEPSINSDAATIMYCWEY